MSRSAARLPGSATCAVFSASSTDVNSRRKGPSPLHLQSSAIAAGAFGPKARAVHGSSPARHLDESDLEVALERLLITLHFELESELSRPAVEPAADTTADDDEAAIRSLTDGYATAWSAADAATITSYYASNGDLIGVEGRVSKGHEEIEARVTDDFSGMFSGTQITINTDSVRFLEPGVAITNGSFEVTGIKGPDGEAADPLNGLYRNVLVKEDGEWRIALPPPDGPRRSSDGIRTVRRVR